MFSGGELLGYYRGSKLKTEKRNWENFLESMLMDPGSQIEATGNWYYFYELIENLNPDVYLSHPQRTRAIASAGIKTDR